MDKTPTIQTPAHSLLGTPGPRRCSLWGGDGRTEDDELMSVDWDTNDEWEDRREGEKEDGRDTDKIVENEHDKKCIIWRKRMVLLEGVALVNNGTLVHLERCYILAPRPCTMIQYTSNSIMSFSSLLLDGDGREP